MIALCVGHSRLGDSGAQSVDGTSEWDYNSHVANILQADLCSIGIVARVYDDYRKHTYSAAMVWLSRQLKADGAHAAVELHFNSAGSAANGFEYLHWRGSARGAALASRIHAAHVAACPDDKDRGIKSKGSGDRGAAFLRLTHCPAVICEPFFGSNGPEWAEWEDSAERLAAIYAAGIADWMDTESPRR